MEILLTVDETVKGLQIIYKDKYGRPLPDSILNAVSRIMSLAEKSKVAAKRLDSYCKTMANKNMLVINSCEVPHSILPSGHSATLSDVKVKGRGPDDAIYKKHPEMRRWIARGTTTMQLNGPESWFDVVVYANKKFTGGVGDEDDSQPENDEIWREYCLEPPEHAKQIVCMEKINGEAAHFGGRFINGKFYIIAGSKNTHMLIRSKKDLELYTDTRFNVAKIVALAVCETMEELSPRARHIVYSFLHHTKTTAICEILQPEYQHIVDISYLNKPQLNFIAFTPTASEDEETTLTALPPHHNLDLARALGFICAPYTVIVPDCMLEHRDKVRHEFHKEGEVLYYLNQKEETFGIAKAKTVWYVLLRALREKAIYCFTAAKNKPDWKLQDRIKSTCKRFDEIQRWLRLSANCVQAWKKLAESFFQWLNKECEAKRVVGNEIRPIFPVVWKRFLEETGQHDNIPL